MGMYRKETTHTSPICITQSAIYASDIVEVQVNFVIPGCTFFSQA